MRTFVEGDLVETTEGLIFDVKGHVHPPDAIIAYLRYYPSPSGDRVRLGIRYAKAEWTRERLDLLRKCYPQYIRFDPVFNDVISCVPLSAVKKYYNPRDSLAKLVEKSELTPLEAAALRFARLLSEVSNVPLSSMGLGGSVSVGLATSESDIDMLVYGVRNCRKVHATLRELREAGILAKYTEEQLLKLYTSTRDDTPMPQLSFLFHEGRKVSYGFIEGFPYSVRFIMDLKEVKERYGGRIYRPIGRVSMFCTIADDTYSIFTPCRYVIEEVEVISGEAPELPTEVFSFRAKFSDHAQVGERVFVRGKLEEVSERGKKWYRVVLTGGGDTMYVIQRAIS